MCWPAYLCTGANVSGFAYGVKQYIDLADHCAKRRGAGSQTLILSIILVF